MASPLLNFALIGRKSSGKTCLLTALALPKELNEYGLNCNLSRSKKRYEEYLNQNSVKEFFGDESVAKYDEMLDHIDVLINKIKEGKLPDATPLTGKTAHIYNVDTTKQVNFDMALFDYAGELVEAESKVSDSLLKFLASMSGLMVIVELGKNTPEGRKQSALDISNLQQFFKAIETNSDGKTRFNIPIALLITKFDQHQDFNKAEFEKDGQKYVDKLFQDYIESSEGKNIKNLSASMKASTTEGYFKLFPVCSFGYVETKGKSEKKSLNESSISEPSKKTIDDMFDNFKKKSRKEADNITSSSNKSLANTFEIEFPLKSVNVIEPFVWAAEIYGNNLLKEVDEAVNKTGFIGGIFNSFLKDYSSYVKTAESLIPNDSEQKEKLELLGKKSSGLSNKLYISLAISFVLFILGTELFIDRSNIVNIQKNEITIENGLKHQEWLKNYSLSPVYRHSLAKLFILSPQDAIKMVDNIFVKIDEKLWNNASSETDTKLLLVKLIDYVENPFAKRKEEAKNKIDDTLWKDILNANSSELIVAKLNDYIASPYAKRLDEAKTKIDETLWKDILNTTEPKVLIDKLKKYLKNIYAKHQEEALDKLESTLWNDAIQTSETSLQLEKLNNYLELANAKHIDEAKTKVKEITFDLRKTGWIDNIVKLEKKINSNVEVDQSFIDVIKEEFTVVKSEYDEQFNQIQRLKDLENSYNKLITVFNLQQFEEIKAEIVNNINGRDFNDWLKALDQTIDLRNKSLVAPEKWTKFANDTVVQQLYNNCEGIVADNNDITTKVDVLTKISNSNSLHEIKNYTGYVKGEEDYFRKTIYKVKRRYFVKEYNDISDFALKNNNNLEILIKKNNEINNNIQNILDYFKNNADLNKEFGNNIKKLEGYQSKLLEVKKSQELRVDIVKANWPREQLALKVVKEARITIAGESYSVTANTNSKYTKMPKGMSFIVKLVPNEESVVIQAQLKDKSTANYDIVCNGQNLDFDNLSLLNNKSEISIGCKGILEGITSLTNTEYNGSITITTEWLSNMPKLERIK